MDFHLIDLSDVKKYRMFVEMALQKSTSFSVCTFKRYHQKDLSLQYRTFMKAIEPCEREQKKVVLPPHYVKGQSFHLYMLQKETREAILTVPSLQAWGPPDYPEDLAFYTQNQLWFYSASHEGLAFVRQGNSSV